MTSVIENVRRVLRAIRRLAHFCSSNSHRDTEASDGALFVHRESRESDLPRGAGAARERAEVRREHPGSQKLDASPGGESEHPDPHTDYLEIIDRERAQRLARATRRGDSHALRAYAAEFGAAAPFVWRLWWTGYDEAKEALIDALGWLSKEEIIRTEAEIRLACVAGKISRTQEAEAQKALAVARRLADKPEAGPT